MNGYHSGLTVKLSLPLLPLLPALVLLLGWRGMGGGRQSQTPGEVAGYVFLLATLGLAMVLYLGYASFFVVGKVCPLCVTMYVSVIGIFLASGAAASVTLPAANGVRMVMESPMRADPLAARPPSLEGEAATELTA